MLHRNIPFVLVASVLGSLPLAMVVWNTSKDESMKRGVLIWGILQGILFVCRCIHHYSFNKEHATAEQFYHYDNINIIFVALAGCIWGLSGHLFFTPGSIPTYSFLILTLVCMVSGSMNALSSRPWHFLFFNVPAMSPVILHTVLQGTTFYLLMGIAATIYVIITIIFHRNLHSVIHESLTLKHHNFQLINNLKIQTESANKANLDKSRFIAAASHDLRQPLHAVNLFTDVLEHEIKIEKQRDTLDHIRRGLSSMGELFDALMDISRIDAKDFPMNLSQFNTEPLIQNLVRQFVLDAEKSNTSLHYRGSAYWVHSDSLLLEQILRNLISNAVKYTEKGCVEVFCRSDAHKTVTIHIKDNGIGIAEGDHKSIFEEFTQLNNPERDRNKGLGLGLAIVRRLTNLLGLTLRLESEPGVGSEFILEVPKANPTMNCEVTTHLESSGNDNQLHGLKILVIDNEEEVTEATRLMLENWGCEARACNNSDKALSMIQGDDQFDIVLSDFRLAGKLDGVELIQEIRKVRPEQLGLIVSGDNGKEINKKAKGAGLVLLHKPVKPAQLHMAIGKILQNVPVKT